jgi:hypothetical protein
MRVGERVVVLDLASLRPSPVEDPVGSGTALGAGLAARLGGTLVALAAGDPGATDTARRMVRRADRTILLTRDAFADPRSTSLVAAVGAEAVIHVALRNPVDLELGAGTVLIATYHEGPAVAVALANALLAGPAAFPGNLPIALDLDPDQELAS